MQSVPYDSATVSNYLRDNPGDVIGVFEQAATGFFAVASGPVLEAGMFLWGGLATIGVVQRGAAYALGGRMDASGLMRYLLTVAFVLGLLTFWQQAYTNLLRFSIDLFRLDDEPWVTLQDVYRMAISETEFEERLQAAGRRDPGGLGRAGVRGEAARAGARGGGGVGGAPGRSRALGVDRGGRELRDGAGRGGLRGAEGDPGTSAHADCAGGRAAADGRGAGGPQGAPAGVGGDRPLVPERLDEARLEAADVDRGRGLVVPVAVRHAVGGEGVLPAAGSGQLDPPEPAAAPGAGRERRGAGAEHARRGEPGVVEGRRGDAQAELAAGAAAAAEGDGGPGQRGGLLAAGGIPLRRVPVVRDRGRERPGGRRARLRSLAAVVGGAGRGHAVDQLAALRDRREGVLAGIVPDLVHEDLPVAERRILGGGSVEAVRPDGGAQAQLFVQRVGGPARDLAADGQAGRLTRFAERLEELLVAAGGALQGAGLRRAGQRAGDRDSLRRGAHATGDEGLPQAAPAALRGTQGDGRQASGDHSRPGARDAAAQARPAGRGRSARGRGLGPAAGAEHGARRGDQHHPRQYGRGRLDAAGDLCADAIGLGGGAVAGLGFDRGCGDRPDHSRGALAGRAGGHRGPARAKVRPGEGDVGNRKGLAPADRGSGLRRDTSSFLHARFDPGDRIGVVLIKMEGEEKGKV